MQKKYLFIDRDGTLIQEPEDQQIDHVEKLVLMPDVIPALLQLKQAGYTFIMISNQDGLGTNSFPKGDFLLVQNLLLRILDSQGINFENILICPHFTNDNCECRKPKLGLVLNYLREQTMDRERSYVIGDRETDILLAENMGLTGIQIGSSDIPDWKAISQWILGKSRTAKLNRQTTETDISVRLNLDEANTIAVNTPIGFFSHMLEQLAKHGGFNLELEVKGDLHIDDHHTIEDTAIALGKAIRQALGDKFGIARYGFVLPMDESIAHVALDLSGRAYLKFDGEFTREKIGELSTELIPHFFRSFAEGLKANLHIQVKGENTHHMVESIFKCVGRVLRDAIKKVDFSLPSTKGIL